MTLASCVCTPIDHGSQSERRTVFCLFVYVFVFVIIKKVFSPTSASKFPQIFLVFQGYNFDTSGLRMLQYHQHSSVTPEAVFIGSLISWGSFEQIKTGTYFGNSKKKKRLTRTSITITQTSVIFITIHGSPRAVFVSKEGQVTVVPNVLRHCMLNAWTDKHFFFIT